MINIAILLSTYNGASFLQDQIESILNQTNKEWNLFIRDDGSSDETLTIINKYINSNNNIVLLEDMEIRRNACNSFLWMLDKIEANYYMFCDQDDVWLPNKIDVLYGSMLIEEQRAIGKPILINTDLIVAESNLNIIAESFWKFANIDPYMIGEKYLIITNYITGCTTFFNHRVKEIAFPVSNTVIMHDYWIALSVFKHKGSIISLPIATVIYRQHNLNTLGAIKYSNSLLDKIKNIRKIIIYNAKLYKMVKSTEDISIIFFLRLKLFYYVSILFRK
jgi:glycosyltransferase involved in cell wall biosynthesis